MIRLSVVLGALLLAAPIFSQEHATSQEPAWLELKLNETREQVKAIMGAAPQITPYGDLETWRYQLGGVADHDDFSHELVFRVSTGRLISVTRSFDPEQNVDALFPPEETTVHHYPDAEHPQFSARLRKLAGGRWLLAMGSSGPGKPAGKLYMISEKEAAIFLDWIK